MSQPDGTPAVRTVASSGLLIAALALVGFNLRSTVASLPPVLSAVTSDIPMGGALAGLVTAAPVLCMAWLAPLGARWSARAGHVRAMAAAVALVGIGNTLRGVSTSAAFLLAVTVVAGAGMSLSGVVAPALISRWFPGHLGAATGAWSVSMMLGAAAAASATPALYGAWSTWRPALGVWGLPALVALVVWVVVSRRTSTGAAPVAERARLPWRQRPAWLLAGYLSAQSALAYAYLAWLPPAYVDRGWTPVAAGALVGVNNIAQLLAALTLPALADRVRSFQGLLLAAVSLTVVGTVWFWLLPGFLPFVAAVVLGFGLGSGFSLGLTRITHYAASPHAASRLTAMVFLISYSVAAAAPVTVGALLDATGGYTVPFAVLALVATAEWLVATRLSDRYRGHVAAS